MDCSYKFSNINENSNIFISNFRNTFKLGNNKKTNLIVDFVILNKTMTYVVLNKFLVKVCLSLSGWHNSSSHKKNSYFM